MPRSLSKNIRYPVSVDTGLRRLAEQPLHAEHVDDMVRQVLFTNPGERVNRPDFGCGLLRMVFAPNSEATANLTQVTVRQALDKWLDDVIDVEQVETTAEAETLNVTIVYRLLSTGERRYLNTELGI
ncbi:MAG: GPW/gp25 family protein [Chloroflexota bacterium]